MQNQKEILSSLKLNSDLTELSTTTTNFLKVLKYTCMYNAASIIYDFHLCALLQGWIFSRMLLSFLALLY